MYVGRNAGARLAEPVYGELVRVYVSGRSLAHLTDVAEDEPVVTLCQSRAVRRVWRGRNDEREEQRAAELRLCQGCSRIADERAGT
jgi:predicted Fe-S protein YdhL (DUF1289 family)